MDRSRTRWLLVVAAVLVWALAIYPAYYVVHKPLSVANLRALWSAVTDLLTAMAFLSVATALGSRLTRPIAYHSLSERLIFSAGLGLVVFSLLTFGLGLVGLLYRWLFWALLVGLGLLLREELWNLGRTLRQASWSPQRDMWARVMGSFVVVTLLLALLLALTPPVEWDTLIYHLAAPEQYLRAHRITHRFDSYALLLPLFTEMLFTMGMALKSDIVPRLIHFSFLLLTLGAMGAFAARYWERRLGLLAAALFLTIPTAVLIATWSYVDLAVTFYSFAAVCALSNWLHAKKPTVESPRHGSVGWLILAGVFAGATISIKYMGAFILPVLGAILYWQLIRGRLTVRRFFVAGLTLVGIAAVVGGGWYIKNAIVVGNPIYPLVWGGREWNEISTRWLLALGEKKSILDLLMVPWTLTVLGTQGTVAYDATFSPLFLLILPLLLFVPRKAKGLAELSWAAAVGYFAWLVSGAVSYGQFVLQGRFLLPVFAPLSLLCAYALEGMQIWDRRSFSLRRLLTMIVALTMAATLLSQALFVAGFNPVPYLTGHQSRKEYLDKRITQRWNEAITYINENLSTDQKVLFVWEPRSYGIRVPYEPDVVFDNVSQLVYRYGSAPEMVTGLCREGFSHLLVNQYTYTWIVTDYPFTPKEKAMWEEFQARYLPEEAIVYTDGQYLVLYRLPCAVKEGS
jgi:hypothetical protein